MTSTVDNDSFINKQRNHNSLQATNGTMLKEVGTKEEANTKAQIKPGVYIALEGGRLVPCPSPNQTLIPSLNAASRSIDLPIKISQTLTLSPSSVQKGNSGVKRILQVTKRPTEESLDPVLNKKHKAEININEQGKNIKSDSSIRDFLSDSVGNLKCNTGADSGNNGDSTPEYSYATQEDDVDVRKGDHDYGQIHNPEYRRGLYENQEERTIHRSSQDGLNEDNEVEVVESTSQEIKPSFQAKQHVLLKTSLQSNDHGKTHTKGTPCTSKSACGVWDPVRKLHWGSAQNKRPRVNDKFPEVPVPAHINQYGDCLKTRLGRLHYGLTLNDPPCEFFQGVLKGASGQTLAAMFGDVNLIAKFENEPPEEVGHFMIDTTFKVIPNSTEGVNQLFTISLLLQNVVIPLWYAITSCSSPELYKRILIEFQQHVLDWPFTSFLVNNDPALCKAVRAVFPDTDIYGSWFHYCYSIWKEVNLHKLIEQCQTENSTLLTAVKLLMVVPYLPPSTSNNTSSVTMVDGFEYVREFARENNLPKEFNRVLDYVVVFWFNKVKPENFTLFGKHSCALNHIEVLQLLMLSYMKQNANVWILTRSFQSIARSTYTEFIRFLNGKRLIVKKNRGKKFIAAIRLNMKKLMAGSLDVKTYLEKSTIYLEEILDIFLHPLYPTIHFEKTNHIHTEGWAVRISSD